MKRKYGHEEEVERNFDGDIKDHVVTIDVENGVNRVITCQKPDSWTYGFRIVTYPGGLLITGDMDTYVFERLPDMFNFFRGSTTNSLGYCAEKCCAGNIREYSEDKAREGLDDIQKMYEDDEGWTKELQEKRESLESSWGYEDNRQESFYRLLFEAEFSDGCDAPNTEIMTYRFRWCLKAIKWTIDHYDANDVKRAPSKFRVKIMKVLRRGKR